MIETQESISNWAIATFGTSGQNYEVAERANQELIELDEKLSRGYQRLGPDSYLEFQKKVGSEIADVFIVLMQLGARMGFNSLAFLEKDFEQKTDGFLRYRRLMDKAKSNMGDLISALKVYSTLNVSSEITNHFASFRVHQILKSLLDMGEGMDIDVWDAIDKKMAVNRARKWDVKNGFGQHIPDGTE